MTSTKLLHTCISNLHVRCIVQNQEGQTDEVEIYVPAGVSADISATTSNKITLLLL